MKTTGSIFLVACLLAAGPMDVSAQALEFVGECSIPAPGVRLTLEGEYAYVAALYTGLHVVNIGDPGSPVLTGSCDTPGWAISVAVGGSYAYVADSSYGVQIINVADPTDPTLVGNISPPEVSYGVFVKDDYLYVGEGWAGLRIFEITDPVHPVPVGSCDVHTSAVDLFVLGDYAYISDCYYGLSVVDVSDVTIPALIGSCPIAENTWGIHAVGNYAYLAAGLSGLQIFDTSEPENPLAVGSYAAQQHAYAVWTEANYAFMSDLSYGLKMIDVVDPRIPVIVDSYVTPGNAYGVVVRLNHVYVANDEYLTILRFNPRDHQCFSDAVFSQPGTMPEGDYWGRPSDVNSQYRVYDNLPGVSGSVCRIRFWGGGMYYSDDWYACHENPMDFDIIFYEDDSGYPGAEICSRTATITGIPTGVYYPYGDQMLNMHVYETVLDDCCVIDEGWISIQGSSYGDPQDCLFFWLNSQEGDGDDYSLWWDGSSYVSYPFDWGLCLGGEVISCEYIAGDCNHNGTPLELGDVVAMIGMYRGSADPEYTCPCPPNGDDFAAEADPNGNCVALELGDVVTEIGAYRGTSTASGCEDCPGSEGLTPFGKDGPAATPASEFKSVIKAGSNKH